MSNITNPLLQIALAPVTSQIDSTAKKGTSSFFEAMSRAWGDALDKQAALITEKSEAVSAGDDTPGAITELSALSMRFGFEASASHTATSAVSEGLSTVSRKQ